MIRLAIFIVISVFIIYFSRRSIFRPRSHGFARFFVWEFLLALIPHYLTLKKHQPWLRRESTNISVTRFIPLSCSWHGELFWKSPPGRRYCWRCFVYCPYSLQPSMMKQNAWTILARSTRITCKKPKGSSPFCFNNRERLSAKAIIMSDIFTTHDFIFSSRSVWTGEKYF